MVERVLEAKSESLSSVNFEETGDDRCIGKASMTLRMNFLQRRTCLMVCETLVIVEISWPMLEKRSNFAEKRHLPPPNRSLANLLKAKYWGTCLEKPVIVITRNAAPLQKEIV